MVNISNFWIQIVTISCSMVFFSVRGIFHWKLRWREEEDAIKPNGKTDGCVEPDRCNGVVQHTFASFPFVDVGTQKAIANEKPFKGIGAMRACLPHCIGTLTLLLSLPLHVSLSLSLSLVCWLYKISWILKLVSNVGAPSSSIHHG